MEKLRLDKEALKLAKEQEKEQDNARRAEEERLKIEKK